MPQDVAVAVLALMRQRLEAGQALLSELEAVVRSRSVGVERRNRAGIMAIDSESGLSGRSAVGRRKVRKD
jgi:hypothetical protein